MKNKFLHIRLIKGTNVLEFKCFMVTSEGNNLTDAQNELYTWIKN